MAPFRLHPRLETETAFVADFALSRVLLMDDVRFPWLILVPRRASVAEIHELAHAERLVLIEEIARTGKGLKDATGAPKINVGALGNSVPQLHVHVVARHPGDGAWPGPVWSYGTRSPYDSTERNRFVARLKEVL